ncbi:hypothetical protein N9Y42_11240, partial [Mariniblastus sp.]|nr:hypothetical protein [Mariniblastus sp.]
NDTGLPCWNLGSIEIDQSDARELLGHPHFVETDSRATAGGTEDHWTFQLDDFPVIFLRLRVPYSQMDVHVVSNEIPDESWGVFSRLFPDRADRRLDRPFDEMRHPDDPKFYYNSGA